MFHTTTSTYQEAKQLVGKRGQIIAHLLVEPNLLQLNKVFLVQIKVQKSKQNRNVIEFTDYNQYLLFFKLAITKLLFECYIILIKCNTLTTRYGPKLCRKVVNMANFYRKNNHIEPLNVLLI